MNTIDTRTSTILLVDDNADNLNVLLDYFRDQNLKILVAENGELALQLLEYTHPDLMLLDVLMPGIDGFETCRRLKANPATNDIPVIFLTAMTETAEKVKGFAAGGVDYIIKPFHDEEVLSRVNAHLTINRQRKQLQELIANRDKFFSILAHDLKTPLVSFLSDIRALSPCQPSISEEQRTEILQTMGEQAENLSAMLENLLMWAQLQQGQFPVSPQTFDVCLLVSDNISRAQPIAAQKQISLAQTFAAPINVSADVNILDTIMRNLIVNAVKFTPVGGTVTISVAQQGKVIEIAVADTGIGMHRDQVSNVFRIDAKPQQTGTIGEKGTGLGLLLCKELVEKNGGNIRVESTPEKGSCFTVTLPASIERELDGLG